MKKILLPLLVTSSLFSETVVFDLEELMKGQPSVVERNIDVERTTKTPKELYNSNVERFSKQSLTKFKIKKHKTIDIYVRENFTILANSYVVKQPEHWVKILVKEKQVWQ